MANKAAIEKYQRLLRMQNHVHVEKGAKTTRQQTRAKLRNTIKSKTTSADDKWDAMLKMQSRPVRESQTRLHKRCRRPGCGRPQGIDSRRTGLCRICLRNFMNRAWLPGFRLASW